MTFRLSSTIAVGQKIKTAHGWRKVTAVTTEGAQVKEGIVKFGDVFYGWKLK